MKAMNGKEFGEFVKDMAKDSKPFKVTASYDPDGDCIEFITKPDSFYAERVDDLVTVYYSQNSKQIIGSLIKGVSEFCNEIMKKWPGFAIEIRDGKVMLAHLFLARLWSQKTEKTQIIIKVYEKLIQDAEKTKTEVQLSL